MHCCIKHIIHNCLSNASKESETENSDSNVAVGEFSIASRQNAAADNQFRLSGRGIGGGGATRDPLGTDPRGCLALILVLVALEGHLRPLLASLLPQRGVKALIVGDGDV